MKAQNKRRVVITGMGVVSCFGNEVDAFYSSLLKGESGISKIEKFEVGGLPTQFAGEIKGFDPLDYIEKKQARRIDPFIAYAILSGKKAMEHAGFNLKDLSALDRSRCGITIGVGMSGLTNFYESSVQLHANGYKKISPFFIPYVLTNMAGGLLAIDLGFMGPNYSISTACATGNNAIIAALNHIRNNEADLMICGGAEAPITPIGLAGFIQCRALSSRNEHPSQASRPFDKTRDGFVMGEGAGVLVLESLDHALERGAPIYAELIGGGISCDAYHMTEPHPEGLGIRLCIQHALNDAGIREQEVDLINCHATSTPLGDMAELRAIKEIFSSREKIAINATKSMIGHALGGAGGLEAVATAMGIYTGTIHPTINLENPEEEMDFFIPKQQQHCNPQIAISNSFGFGGHNATIVLKKYNE